MYESTHDAEIQYCCRFSEQKMATLIAAPLSSWHHPTMMKLTLDGVRSVNESRLTLAWMKRSNNSSRKFWSGTKMFLFGTRVN